MHSSKNLPTELFGAPAEDAFVPVRLECSLLDVGEESRSDGGADPAVDVGKAMGRSVENELVGYMRSGVSSSTSCFFTIF